MAVELSTETLTEEGGADGAVCERKRERVNIGYTASPCMRN